MKSEKYIYNEETLQFEKLKLTKKQLVRKWISRGAMFTLCTLVLLFMSYTYLPSPKETTLAKELVQMEHHFASITDEFDQLSTDLEGLKQKDQEVHRLIFGLDPIDNNIWEGGIGGHDKYKYITKYSTNSELIASTSERIDKLKQKIDLQRKSLDTIYTLAIEREEKMTSIPSIKPVQEDKLKRDIRYLSGYGIRLHPVHKVNKFHRGIDFTAPSGTAIQATGNGIVTKVEKSRRGYGNNIIINHGYGYESLYAHMDKIMIKKGDKVVKGQQIGTVGNSGMSTAPHLHYEVLINGKNVNPIDYVLDGLSTEEYHDLVIKASQENQAFDY